MASRGFTLIELLVATTLLLLVSFIGSYGYGLYIDYWNKELGSFEQTIARVKGVTRLQKVIKHIKPYVIKGENDQPFHYFEGGKSVIRSVNAISVANPEFPSVFELKVESDRQNGQRLIYREKVMSERPIYHLNDIHNYDLEIVLLRGFSDLTFEFQGWSSFQQWLQNKTQPGAAEMQWYGYYSGVDTLITPETVKVSLAYPSNTASFMVELSDFISQQLTSQMQSGF